MPTSDEDRGAGSGSTLRKAELDAIREHLRERDGKVEVEAFLREVFDQEVDSPES